MADEPLPEITLMPCTSSNIESLGYCPDTQRLRIKFKSGGQYTYADVPQEAYDAFSQAESIGKHFHSNIRGQFKFNQD